MMYKYLILLILILFIWGFFIEPNLIIIKKYKTDFLKGQKIVFISDYHIAKYDRQRLRRIVNKINQLKPDIVLSGGDFIKGHNQNSSLKIEEQAKELARIKAPIITVLGNHDNWYDKYTIKQALENIGVKVLINTNTEVNNLYIAGIDDIKTGFPNVSAALENTDSPRILLTHSPDIYLDVKEDVDLILAGHVHGGQVKFPIIGSVICPSKYGTKFCGGDYKETKNRMIVTTGLGTSILNVRFLNPPEIIVIE